MAALSSIQVRIDDNARERLEAMRGDRSAAAVIREALDAYLLTKTCGACKGTGRVAKKLLPDE